MATSQPKRDEPKRGPFLYKPFMDDSVLLSKSSDLSQPLQENLVGLRDFISSRGHVVTSNST